MRADRVMELRELLDKLGDVAGLMGEEKGKFDIGRMMFFVLKRVGK